MNFMQSQEWGLMILDGKAYQDQPVKKIPRSRKICFQKRKFPCEAMKCSTFFRFAEMLFAILGYLVNPVHLSFCFFLEVHTIPAKQFRRVLTGKGVMKWSESWNPIESLTDGNNFAWQHDMRRSCRLLLSLL